MRFMTSAEDDVVSVGVNICVLVILMVVEEKEEKKK